MDHAMEYIKNYMQSDVYELLEEIKSRQYKGMTSCPSYYTVKAYCDAYNTLAREYYNEEDVKKYLIHPVTFLK